MSIFHRREKARPDAMHQAVTQAGSGALQATGM